MAAKGFVEGVEVFTISPHSSLSRAECDVTSVRSPQLAIVFSIRGYTCCFASPSATPPHVSLFNPPTLQRTHTDHFLHEHQRIPSTGIQG
ncbi:hypothetical protein E2C01_018714 [Portunus trituberculatus]|uniref:Uncharacterized protein n=1 Tax=Portunus trituberculatus TaxID=210409 RepID=A0A5B7DWE3_PORTR|nr:hypothetical protein [Portunus trituberculatus]